MNKLAPFKFKVALDYTYFHDNSLPSIILTQEYNGRTYSNTKVLHIGDLENNSIMDWVWNTVREEFERQIKAQKTNEALKWL